MKEKQRGNFKENNNNNNNGKSSTVFINAWKERYYRCVSFNPDNEKSTFYLPYIIRELMDCGKE